jgi:hypothetical protein
LTSVLLVTALLLSLPLITFGASGSLGLFGPSDSPFGISFLDWAKRWWSWNFSLDKSVHPILDASTEKCISQNQTSNVLFLPVPDATVKQFAFTCTVPQGKAIMVAPLVTGESDSGEGGGEEEIRQRATAGQVGASLAVWIDGVNQNYSLQDMRVTSDFFNLTFGKNNIVDAPEGTYNAIIDGYYIFLKPLSQGHHELKFQSQVHGNPDKKYDLAQEGTYVINVK